MLLLPFMSQQVEQWWFSSQTVFFSHNLARTSKLWNRLLLLNRNKGYIYKTKSSLKYLNVQSVIFPKNENTINLDWNDSHNNKDEIKNKVVSVNEESDW